MRSKSFKHGRSRSLSDPLAKALLPPPDETPEDRERRLRSEQEAQKVSDAIDEQIKLDRQAFKKQKQAIKVLLLGQSESGRARRSNSSSFCSLPLPSTPLALPGAPLSTSTSYAPSAVSSTPSSLRPQPSQRLILRLWRPLSNRQALHIRTVSIRTAMVLVVLRVMAALLVPDIKRSALLETGAGHLNGILLRAAHLPSPTNIREEEEGMRDMGTPEEWAVLQS